MVASNRRQPTRAKAKDCSLRNSLLPGFGQLLVAPSEETVFATALGGHVDSVAVGPAGDALELVVGRLALGALVGLAELGFDAGQDGFVDSVAPLPFGGRFELGDFGGALAGKQVCRGRLDGGLAGGLPGPAPGRLERCDFRFVLAGDQQLQRRVGVVVADETRRVPEEFGDALVVGEVATVDDDDDASLVTAHVGIHMLSPLVWSFDRVD